MYITEEDINKALIKHISKRKGAYGSIEGIFSEKNENINFKKIADDFNKGEYIFGKVKSCPIPKNRGGNRYVFKMNKSDFLVQRAALNKYEEMYPCLFNESVVAFRKHYGPSKMIKSIHMKMKSMNIRYMLHVDIKEFSNKIDLSVLLNLIDIYILEDEFKRLLKGYISHERLEEKDRNFFEQGKGIFAGGPLSGFLTNLYFIEFDEFAARMVNEEENNLYYRYGDDVFVFSESMQSLNSIYEEVSWYIRYELRLDVHELSSNGKSSIVPLAQDRYFHFYDYSFNKDEIRIREFIIKKILNDIKMLSERAQNINKLINSINYYFAKDYDYKNYKNDCYFLCFSICTRTSQFVYLDNNIREIVLKKFGDSIDNKEMIRESLCSLKKMYFYIKKVQRKTKEG